MTVATNALLEGARARTALVATEGFTDVVELGPPGARRPLPAVRGAPRAAGPARAALRRARADGPRRPAARARREGRARWRDAVAALRARGRGRRAPALLPPPRARARARRRAGASACPGVHVSLSHEVVGTFREYERAATTEVDAALSPLLAGYLRRLVERAPEAGLPEPAIMQSSGGLADVGLAASHAALTVLSGPAGGAAGAAFAAAAAGIGDVLVLRHGRDVVRRLRDRRRAASPRPPEREVGGRPLALPMLDIHTVGAGGGSVAWRDAGGALRVGPALGGRRARDPPATAAAATEPTVTDANLLLGYLPAGEELAGGVRARPRRRRAGGRRAGGRARPRRRSTAPRGSSAWPTPRWRARCAS